MQEGEDVHIEKLSNILINVSSNGNIYFNHCLSDTISGLMDCNNIVLLKNTVLENITKKNCNSIC